VCKHFGISGIILRLKNFCTTATQQSLLEFKLHCLQASYRQPKKYILYTLNISLRSCCCNLDDDVAFQEDEEALLVAEVAEL